MARKKLECEGPSCSLLLRAISRRMHAMQDGQLLKLESNDPAFKANVELFAKKMGYQLVNVNETLEKLTKEFEEVEVALAEKDELLEKRSQDLNNVNTNLQKALAELQQKTYQLEAAAKAAKEASSAKSVFLTNMSHELRTPLNAILGIGEMLLEEAKESDDENKVEALSRICNSGNHLLQLINDILDLAKIEAGKMNLLIEEFDLKRLIDEIAVLTEPLAKANNNKFIVEYHVSQNLKASNDATKLKQVLLNLLSNACKFTENGKVELQVFEEEKLYLKFVVIDNGIGIAPEHIPIIFEKFVQADLKIAGKFGGTGLGLAITKKICEMMHGTINVVSEVGKGSTFTVVVPMRVDKAKDDKHLREAL